MSLYTFEIANSTPSGLMLDIMTFYSNSGGYKAVFKKIDGDEEWYCKDFSSFVILSFRLNTTILKVRDVPVTRELTDILLDTSTGIVDIAPFLSIYRGFASAQALETLVPGTVMQLYDDVSASSSLTPEADAEFYALFTNLP